MCRAQRSTPGRTEHRLDASGWQALHCGTPEYAARAVGWGFDMTTVSNDVRLLAGAAADSVRRFRALTGDKAEIAESKGGY